MRVALEQFRRVESYQQVPEFAIQLEAAINEQPDVFYTVVAGWQDQHSAATDVPRKSLCAQRR